MLDNNEANIAETTAIVASKKPQTVKLAKNTKKSSTASKKDIVLTAGYTNIKPAIEPVNKPAEVVRTEPALPADALARGWLNVFERQLDYGMTLTSAEQIQSLLAMTPHAHRISAAARAALCAVTSLNVTVSVVLRAMQRPVTAGAA